MSLQAAKISGLLGSPPSVRSPEVREDKESRASRGSTSIRRPIFACLRVRKRRQGTRNTEANTRSYRGGVPSSLFHDQEDGEGRRLGDASLVEYLAAGPGASSDTAKMPGSAWVPLLSCGALKL